MRRAISGTIFTGALIDGEKWQNMCLELHRRNCKGRCSLPPSCRHDPATVTGALLGDNIDKRFMQDVFDHEVGLPVRWLGQGNRAVEHPGWDTRI